MTMPLKDSRVAVPMAVSLAVVGAIAFVIGRMSAASSIGETAGDSSAPAKPDAPQATRQHQQPRAHPLRRHRVDSSSARQSKSADHDAQPHHGQTRRGRNA
jgi:hypothetical protein